MTQYEGSRAGDGVDASISTLYLPDGSDFSNSWLGGIGDGTHSATSLSQFMDGDIGISMFSGAKGDGTGSNYSELHLMDGLGPVILFCPNDTNIFCDMLISWEDPIALDLNTNESLVPFQFVTSPLPGLSKDDLFPKGGPSTVKYIYSDEANNQVECQFTIEIIDQISVNQRPVDHGMVHTSDEIHSSGLIESGSDVQFKAANTILLNNNFEVEAGALFIAETKPCPNPDLPDP